MTRLRWVWLVVAVGAAVTTAAVLGWPGWSWAPLGAVVVAAAAASAVIVRRPRPGRFDLALCTAAVVAAVVATVVALVTPDGRDDGPDRGLEATASATITRLLTFTPADFAPDAAQRRAAALSTELTGRLATDYRSQGPNAVLASAVESGASSALAISSVGVAESTRQSVRLLVFAAQTITLPTATPSRATVPIARWAVMRRVDGTWRLADLYPVGLNG